MVIGVVMAVAMMTVEMAAAADVDLWQKLEQGSMREEQRARIGQVFIRVALKGNSECARTDMRFG